MIVLSPCFMACFCLLIRFDNLLSINLQQFLSLFNDIAFINEDLLNFSRYFRSDFDGYNRLQIAFNDNLTRLTGLQLRVTFNYNDYYVTMIMPMTISFLPIFISMVFWSLRGSSTKMLSRHSTLTTATVISSSSSVVISAPKVVASLMSAETIASAEVSGVKLPRTCSN